MLLSVHEEAALGWVGAVDRTTDTVVATAVEFLAGLEHLAQVGFVKVGDKLAVVIIKTHLATLLQRHDVCHGIYQVISNPVTLHTLTRAHDWRLTNPDMLSITKDGGRDHQEHEDTNNEASHGGAGT